MDMARKAREEALAAQEAELSSNLSKLGPESKMQVILLTRKLIQQEAEAALYKKIMEAFNKLNREGKRLAIEYIEALTLDPRYRK